MKKLYSRLLEVYRQKGFFGLVKSIITYPFRRFNLRWQYLNLFALYYLQRGKRTLNLGGSKIQLLVSQLADAKGLCHTYSWERFFWNYILKELKPDDVFWDVGANIGFYTLLAASYSDVKVIAFEPNPTTVKLLEKNIKLNNRSNVKVLDLALSDSEGTVSFDMVRTESTDATAHLAYKETDSAVKVVTNRGDNLIKSGDVPAPNILKVDVEGAEYLVAKGMGDALSKCRFIFCEVHSTIARYGGTIDEFMLYLKNAGFKVEYQKNIPGYDSYHVIARRVN